MIEYQFVFCGTDQEIWQILRQHFGSKLKAFAIGIPVVYEGRAWTLSWSPQVHHRPLVPTIDCIEFTASSSPLHYEEYWDEAGPCWRPVRQEDYPRAELGINLELGIVVNHKLKVIVKANPVFAENVVEILNVLDVDSSGKLCIDKGDQSSSFLQLDVEPQFQKSSVQLEVANTSDGTTASNSESEDSEREKQGNSDPRDKVLKRLSGKNRWTDEDWNSYFDAWYEWTHGTQPNLTDVESHCGKSSSSVTKKHASYKNRKISPY